MAADIHDRIHRRGCRHPRWCCRHRRIRVGTVQYCTVLLQYSTVQYCTVCRHRVGVFYLNCQRRTAVQVSTASARTHTYKQQNNFVCFAHKTPSRPTQNNKQFDRRTYCHTTFVSTVPVRNNKQQQNTRFTFVTIMNVYDDHHHHKQQHNNQTTTCTTAARATAARSARSARSTSNTSNNGTTTTTVVNIV